MKYELTKELETGNSIIDREHKELFQAVNQMIDACSGGKGRTAMEPAIQFLLSYVDKHFAHEEQLKQMNNYPDIAAHKMFHAGYTRKLREIISAIPAAGPSIADVGKLNQHIAVLVTHIKTEDKKMSTFLKRT